MKTGNHENSTNRQAIALLGRRNGVLPRLPGVPYSCAFGPRRLSLNRYLRPNVFPKIMSRFGWSFQPLTARLPCRLLPGLLSSPVVVAATTSLPSLGTLATSTERCEVLFIVEILTGTPSANSRTRSQLWSAIATPVWEGLNRLPWRAPTHCGKFYRKISWETSEQVCRQGSK